MIVKKNTRIIIAILTFSIFFSCSKDDCNGQEVDLPDGQTICIKNFDVGFAAKAVTGDYLYHEKHGLIRLTEKGWVDDNLQLINLKDQ